MTFQQFRKPSSSSSSSLSPSSFYGNNRLSPIRLISKAVIFCLLVTLLNQSNFASIQSVNGEFPTLPFNLSDTSGLMQQLSQKWNEGMEMFQWKSGNDSATSTPPDDQISSEMGLVRQIRTLHRHGFENVRNRIYYRREQMGNMTASLLERIRKKFDQQGSKSGNETTRKYWFGYRDRMDSIISRLRARIERMRQHRLSTDDIGKRINNSGKFNQTPELLKQLSSNAKEVASGSIEKLMGAEKAVDALVEKKNEIPDIGIVKDTKLPNNLRGLIENLPNVLKNPETE